MCTHFSNGKRATLYALCAAQHAYFIFSFRIDRLVEYVDCGVFILNIYKLNMYGREYTSMLNSTPEEKKPNEKKKKSAATRMARIQPNI